MNESKEKTALDERIALIMRNRRQLAKKIKQELRQIENQAVYDKQVKFLSHGFRLNNQFYCAPALVKFQNKIVTVIPDRILENGFEVVKVFYQGKYVTDAFYPSYTPWNKQLDKQLQECTDKQIGLYL